METPMSASSPRGCFECVPLLYNSPNPQADSDNIDSMSLYLLLCWGLIQQKNRQRQKGEARKWVKEIKGKGLLLCTLSMCFTENLTNVGHQTRLNFPSHRSPFTSPTGERRATFTDGQPCQTYFAHSYLPRENKRSNVCRGALLAVAMFSSSMEPLLGSVSSEELLCGAASECCGQQARSGGDAFRTADSASARRTCARSKLSSRG